MTWRQIYQATNVHWNTARSVYERYLELGTVVPTKKTGRPAWPLPKEVADYLRNELVSQRFLSLRDRAAEVRRKFDFPMSYTRLRGHFRRIGVRF